MRKTFGIVGATGATGQQVLSAMQNLGASGILVGGRNPMLLRALTEKSAGAVEAKRIDIDDPALLDAFCAEVLTVVNCAGPASAFGDRLAHAAFRNKCNYVDAAGLSIVSDGLNSVKDKVRDTELTFVLSAGWMPGLSELLPAYAYDLAMEKYGSADRITVYFGDWGHWSSNAAVDAEWFMRKRRAHSAGSFQRGVWKPDRSATLRKENLGEPLVEGQFAPFYTPELESLGMALADADFGAWAHNCEERGPGLAAAVSLLSFKQTKTTGVIRKEHSGYNQPVGGFVVAKAETLVGKCCTVVATYGKGHDYEINGAVLATAACLVGHHAAHPGVHYFWEAFNRPNVIEWLKSAGVRVTESCT